MDKEGYYGYVDSGPWPIDLQGFPWLVAGMEFDVRDPIWGTPRTMVVRKVNGDSADADDGQVSVSVSKHDGVWCHNGMFWQTREKRALVKFLTDKA